MIKQVAKSLVVWWLDLNGKLNIAKYNIMQDITRIKHQIGRSVELERIFKDKDVQEYAILTGDTNLIHLDDQYAATTRFKKRLVHGMSVASLFSTIFGTIYPGAGTIYVSQTLNFKQPVYIGDKILATVTLRKIHDKKPIGYFDTICRNQNMVEVIAGEAILVLP